jgi:hypothetical protein
MNNTPMNPYAGGMPGPNFMPNPPAYIVYQVPVEQVNIDRF